MKILVVEDTEDSRILLEDQLAVEGYEVVSAVNGEEGLEKAKQASPDLIISDILMPKMDGFELCRQLKKNPQLKFIPFIFYTATYTDSRDEKLAMSLGASRFVIKPQDPVKLIEIIKDVISRIDEVSHQPGLNNHALDQMHSDSLMRKLEKKVQQLDTQKEQLRLITDALPVLIAEVDKDYRYLYVNKTYGDWFNLSCDEIVGKRMDEIIGDEAFRIIKPHTDKALKGKNEIFEEHMIFPDAIERDVFVRYISRFNEDGSVRGFITLVSDVSERKKSEEEKEQLREQLYQAQKMESIGHLAGGIAHDFNNILTAIMGYTDLALIESGKGEYQQIDMYLKQVDSAGERAKNLISQLLEFSRQTGGVRSPVDLQLIVSEVIKLLRPSIRTSIKININFSGENAFINADPVQLHQVLMNLCINARDAITDHGQIDVAVNKVHVKEMQCRSCAQKIQGDFIELAVSDTGTGIDSNNIEQIFKPLFTTKEMGRGTGMGLAMVDGIVHKNDGHIVLDSEQGQGTTFRLLFPECSAAEISIEHVTEKPADYTDKGHHIMVVDDEMLVARFLEDWLTLNGYRVTVFTESPAALECFKNRPDDFDLIVLDQTMPVMTGLELSSEILKIRSGFPIILCSGFSEKITQKDLAELGMGEYFQKPINTKKLLQKIRDRIEQK